MDWSNIYHFKQDEFRCKCGCGKADMDEEFMLRLDQMRMAAGFPFIVTSGYRCPDYNDQVSSTGRTGPHTTGKAADISARGHEALKIVDLALSHSMTGIGVAQKGGGRFIHLDCLVNGERGAPRPWIWSY